LNILITGGSGLLGGRLGRHLAQNHSVYIGSRQDPGFSFSYQHRYLDLLNLASLDSSLAGIDQVIHLAALNYQQCQDDPDLAEKVNVQATQELVRLATLHEIKKLLYFSTVHVYGTPLEGELKENGMVHPANAYARTHYQAEKFIMSNKSGVVVRLSNSVGAPENKQTNCWMLLANDLCQQAVRQKQLTLKTHGLQSRNFIPINDLLTFCSYLLEKNPHYQLYNLGSPKNNTILEITQMVANACEKTLGYLPPIIKPSAPENFLEKEFHLDLNLLQSEAVVLNFDLNGEIVQLLKACEEWF